MIVTAASYKILLTLIPPHPNKTGEDARNAIASSGLALFNTGIPRLAVFQKAALERVPVNQVKDDSYTGIAWRCYLEVGKEI
jgi:chromosome partitioning protein